MGEEADWRFLEWDTEWDARVQVKTFRVLVRITNYPEEFWHPVFINQLISQFGDVQKIDQENLGGNDQLITCISISGPDASTLAGYCMHLPFLTGFYGKKAIF